MISLLNSSMTVRMRNRSPVTNCSAVKSSAQPSFGPAAERIGFRTISCCGLRVYTVWCYRRRSWLPQATPLRCSTQVIGQRVVQAERCQVVDLCRMRIQHPAMQRRKALGGAVRAGSVEVRGMPLQRLRALIRDRAQLAAAKHTVERSGFDLLRRTGRGVDDGLGDFAQT